MFMRPSITIGMCGLDVAIEIPAVSSPADVTTFHPARPFEIKSSDANFRASV
jgi:transcription elongation factor Elf1